ncbi:MAG TPA: beta-ketoacyl synthase N-terminal-like domain-containing protein [Pseudonocardiaceae bacterium]|nr:beta-ketoacyl synthase N-terminal-like domain-containing protein [Pseudonocardiaceae bacterium]
MTTFEPIAIVGRGCVLPGALTPAQFWDDIAHGTVSIGPVLPTDWRLPPHNSPDATAGMVRGFDEVFDPTGFHVAPGEVATADPALRWVLHAARAALREAGRDGPQPRAGLILGSLGFPSRGLAAYAERVWLADRPDLRATIPEPPGITARSRFCSGLPAHTVAQALGLGGGAVTVEAACASALYAVKIACDRLHDGTTDLMLAGAVSGCDGLIINLGFAALGGLSRTGRSRPFHREADGLVPAEGVAMVALMRLRDAVAGRVPILGVGRGVGLSNDGRTGGFLAPAEDGQTRAMRAAYQQAGFGPDTVSLLECHATGTPIGDAVEARSTAAFFAGHPDLPVGSAKSNVGHLLTASGAAGLLKLLGAIEAGVRPATAGDADPIGELCGPLRLLTANEPWPGRRRAALSAFGFGGNNAHLVLEAFDPAPVSVAMPRPAGEIAIVALGTRVAGHDADAFRDALLTGRPLTSTQQDIDVTLAGLRFPPRDLAETLGQQVLVLEAARDAASGVGLPAERTMILIGMGTDPETARIHARQRLDAWPATPAGTAVSPTLTAARVLGSMANITANRVGAQLDLAGPAFAVCAEEASGSVALDLAVRALRAGEVDAAVVGAVDLSDEPVHPAAVAELGGTMIPSNAAVVLVVKRLADARAAGDPVLATIEPRTETKPDWVIGAGDFEPAELFGAPHAARGLLAVAAATLALRHRALPRVRENAAPWPTVATADVVTPVLGTAPHRIRLRAGDAASWSPVRPPEVHVYTGAELDLGDARLAVVARDARHLGEQLAAARRWLADGGPRPDGVAFRAEPVGGETAFVYTKGSAAYAGMGADLMLAFPGLADMDGVDLAAWAYRGDGRPGDSLEQILGVGYVARLHTRISREVLGIRPDAAIGYSSGESAALVALDVWRDASALAADARASELFTHELGGELRAVRRYWARTGIVGEQWSGFVVSADAERVREMVRDEIGVHLTAVCAPGTCVIAGERQACESFVKRLEPGACVRINYDLVAHAPEVEEVRERWHALHRRPCADVPDIRFYRGATGEPYHPTADSAADALTEQAIAPVDFPAVIERAWRDGVRVFIEHGPGAQCTGWIRRILGSRNHVAVAMDAPQGDGLWPLATVVAELAAAGVDVRVDALPSLFGPPPTARGATVSVPTRLPAPTFPAVYTVLERAPELTPMPAATPSPVVAWQDMVTAAHNQYLDLQTSVHQQFLATRAAALSALRAPRRPRFDRATLEHLAVGRISDVFGPRFAVQDDDVRQTRMPRPPLLLADRVTGIDAEPGSMSTGTIWTETDITRDAWYLDATGRMPAGLLVEAGQADLLLISWLGADLENRGRRVYRLLGSEVTFHAAPPAPGATLRYEIRVVDHVTHGPVRLFFFEYDCRSGGELVLTVRQGQAGFFSDEELANTGGVLWDPAASTPEPDPPMDPPAVRCTADSFDAAAVLAFSDGRPDECFGPGWEVTRADVRSPRIGSGRLRLLDEVPVFDPAGGPWRRGYLRAHTAISAEDWFFDGHFHNDPCMPGTLMSEGCLQAVSFFLAACGFTVGRDGWRFEPVAGRPSRMRCRGQATPASRSLTYEVFVSSVTAGPVPTVVADVLVTVDAVKALHVADCAVRLVPDWPLDQWRHSGLPAIQRTADPVPPPELGGLVGHVDPEPVASIEGLRLGYASLLACAWGRPSDGLGPMAEVFAGPRRPPRLPGPPYHFMSRVTAITGPYQGMAVGSTVDVAYDVPDEAWYFAERTMPVAVLMEMALQPCGWLGCYVGSPVQMDTELLFRNLDGDIRLFREVRPGTKAVRTRAELTAVSHINGMIIESFRIDCEADGEPLLGGTAVFGYFSAAAFADQPGLPPTSDERARLVEPTSFTAAPRDHGPMLTMLDRITGYWPEGGAAGLGRVRAEIDVDPGAWFFKAHFFQDPVMPGSLGVEAMCQLLRWYMAERGIGDSIEPVAVNEPLTWTYRGQIVPTDRLITIELEILEIHATTVAATAWLWIDGRRIYRLDRFAIRAVAE